MRAVVLAGGLGTRLRRYTTILPGELGLDWIWEPDEPLGTAGALRVVPGLDAGETVSAYRSQADWFDIGTVTEYERAIGEVERRGGWPG